MYSVGSDPIRFVCLVLVIAQDSGPCTMLTQSRLADSCSDMLEINVDE
jgi:hypothetical protein